MLLSKLYEMRIVLLLRIVYVRNYFSRLILFRVLGLSFTPVNNQLLQQYCKPKPSNEKKTKHNIGTVIQIQTTLSKNQILDNFECQKMIENELLTPLRGNYLDDLINTKRAD